MLPLTTEPQSLDPRLEAPAPLVRVDFLPHSVGEIGSTLDSGRLADAALLRLLGLRHPELGLTDPERLSRLLHQRELKSSDGNRLFLKEAEDYLASYQRLAEELARSGSYFLAERLSLVYCDLISILFRLGEVAQAFVTTSQLQGLECHVQKAALLSAISRIIAFSAILVDQVDLAMEHLDRAAERDCHRFSSGQQLLCAMAYTQRTDMAEIVEELLCDGIRDAEADGWMGGEDARRLVELFHSSATPPAGSGWIGTALDRLQPIVVA